MSKELSFCSEMSFTDTARSELNHEQLRHPPGRELFRPQLNLLEILRVKTGVGSLQLLPELLLIQGAEEA